MTMTVTPVLADQLEAEGVGERMRAFIAAHRLGGAEIDAQHVIPEEVPAANYWAQRYGRALERLDALGGDLDRGFAEAQAEGRIALMASAATHAVLPMVATRAGRRLQVDAGLRSHERRFGAAAGFWLPECAYEPGLESLLAERGLAYFCTDQSKGRRDGGPGAGRHARRPRRLDDRLADRAARLVVGRLSRRSRLCRAPQPVAAGDAPVGERQAAL